jgi:cyclic pyranopterin phosphate synthase
MVDTSGKEITRRTASATGKISMSPEALAAVKENRVAKGNVLEVARIAGIMAAKKVSDLVPMCHPLPVENVKVDFADEGDGFRVNTEAVVTAKTGVEMEAITAAAVTLVTIYDMVKAVDKRMVISDIHLVKKTGGKSGEFNY